jgi:hypothetical protein
MSIKYSSQFEKFETIYTPSKSDYTPINNVLQNTDKSFNKTDIGYTNLDPRLLSAGGSRIVLDKPPVSRIVKPGINYTGKHYNSYKDIEGGSITYYTGMENRYNSTVFPSKGRVISYIHEDPMGARTLHHDKISTYDSSYGLSFLRDTNFNRENIIASQSSRYDRERYYEPSRDFL